MLTRILAFTYLFGKTLDLFPHFNTFLCEKLCIGQGTPGIPDVRLDIVSYLLICERILRGFPHFTHGKIGYHFAGEPKRSKAHTDRREKGEKRETGEESEALNASGAALPLLHTQFLSLFALAIETLKRKRWKEKRGRERWDAADCSLNFSCHTVVKEIIGQRPHVCVNQRDERKKFFSWLACSN